VILSFGTGESTAAHPQHKDVLFELRAGSCAPAGRMGDDCRGIGSGVKVLVELLVVFGLLLDHVERVLGRSLPRYGAALNQPPSTRMSFPVMYAESSLARNKAV